MLNYIEVLSAMCIMLYVIIWDLSFYRLILFGLFERKARRKEMVVEKQKLKVEREC